MKKTPLIIVCTSIAVFSSCSPVPTAEIESFGKTAGELQNTTKEFYKRVDESSSNFAIAQLALRNSIEDEDIEDISKGFFEKYKAGEDLKLRLKLAQEIAAYGDALSKLVSASTTEELRKETLELHGALSDLNERYVEYKGVGQDLFNPDDLAFFSSAIDGIGRLYIEQQRRSLLKKVIPRMNVSIQKSCDLVNKDIQNIANQKYIETELDGVYNAALDGYIQDAKKLTYHEKVTRLKELKTMRAAKQNGGRVLTSFSKSVKALAQSHGEIAEVIVKGYRNHKLLRDDIQHFRNLTKETRAFYKELLEPAQ